MGLLLELSTVELHDAEVVEVRYIRLDLPEGILELTVLNLVGVVVDHHLVDENDQLLILHELVALSAEMEERLELLFVILQLRVHLIHEQQSFQVEEHVLELVAYELDEGLQVDQLSISLLDDISHDILDLLAQDENLVLRVQLAQVGLACVL